MTEENNHIKREQGDGFVLKTRYFPHKVITRVYDDGRPNEVLYDQSQDKAQQRAIREWEEGRGR